MLNMIFESMGVQVFDSTRTYKADTAVILYGNSLYRCHTNISAAGAWNAANWTQLTDTSRLWTVNSATLIPATNTHSLALGAFPSNSGRLRFTNADWITWYNQTGTASINVLSLTAANLISIYNGQLTLSSTGDLITGTSLQIGLTSAATSGTIRMQKNPVISMRNAAGSANIDVIEGNSDVIEIANSSLKIDVNDWTILHSDTLKIVSQTDTLIITNASGKWYLNSTDTLVLNKVKCDSIYTTKAAAWADYVFSDNYNLIPFNQEIQFIKSANHLRSLQPETNSKFTTIQDTNKRLEGLVEEVEKLYLYIEQLEIKIKELEK